MGLGVAGFFSQVVKLEGDLVVRVKEAAITQVSMFRYQDLQGKQTEMDREACRYYSCLFRHCVNEIMMTFSWIQ